MSLLSKGTTPPTSVQVHNMEPVVDSSKYSSTLTVPSDFPTILKEFTKEVLRNQPKDIAAFGAEYFSKIVDKKEGKSKPSATVGKEEVSAQKVLWTVQVHTPIPEGYNYVVALSFSPDSSKLVVCSGSHQDVKIMDVATGKCLYTLSGHEGEQLYHHDNILQLIHFKLKCSDWSPDGKHIVTGANKDCRLWDTATMKSVQQFNDPSNMVIVAVSFTLDSQQFVAGVTHYGAGFEVQLWDVKTFQMIKKFSEGHWDRIDCCSVAADVILTSANRDKTARLWERDTGEVIQWFRQTDEVSASCLSKDGKKVFTSSENRTCQIWNVDNSDESVLTTTFPDESGPITCARAFPGGNFLATTMTSSFIWNSQNGEIVAKIGSEEIDSEAMKAFHYWTAEKLKPDFEPSRMWESNDRKLLFATSSVSVDGKRIAISVNDYVAVFNTAAILKK